MSSQEDRHPALDAGSIASPSKIPHQVRDDVILKGSSRLALAGLSLTALLAALGTSSANVALPVLASEFGVSFAAVQWVVLAYLLSITSLIVGVGRLGDILGRRRLLVVGVVLFTLASILGGLASDLRFLIAARALQGAGAAVMMALTMAMVGEAVPKEQTGRAMGLLGTMSAIGTALGPSLGGLLVVGLSWRAIFFINLPLGVLALFLVARSLPKDKAAATPRPRFDIPGTLLLAATLAAYCLATTGGPWILWLVAGVGLLLFIGVESKTASPLVRLSLFRDRALSLGFILGLAVMTVMMATLVVGPFHLAGALGLDAATAGLAMSAGPVVSALSGLPAGRLVDRFGAATMVRVGLAVMSLASAALALMPIGFGVAGYVGPLVFLTAGYATFQAANNTAVMRDVPADRRGVVSGLLNLSRNLGLVTGASVMGTVYAASGMRATFGLAVALILLALMLAQVGRLSR
ncbi:MFS transporter [Lacibacterium aquatile]|uniref:MFS transporter n=1 Tax=Lacibacterium aquatile TaxID=1168082 RepID=A0ABW5DL66_9PROT